MPLKSLWVATTSYTYGNFMEASNNTGRKKTSVGFSFKPYYN